MKLTFKGLRNFPVLIRCLPVRHSTSTTISFNRLVAIVNPLSTSQQTPPPDISRDSLNMPEDDKAKKEKLAAARKKVSYSYRLRLQVMLSLQF